MNRWQKVSKRVSECSLEMAPALPREQRRLGLAPTAGCSKFQVLRGGIACAHPHISRKGCPDVVGVRPQRCGAVRIEMLALVELEDLRGPAGPLDGPATCRGSRGGIVSGSSSPVRPAGRVMMDLRVRKRITDRRNGSKFKLAGDRSMVAPCRRPTIRVPYRRGRARPSSAKRERQLTDSERVPGFQRAPPASHGNSLRSRSGPLRSVARLQAWAWDNEGPQRRDDARRCLASASPLPLAVRQALESAEPVRRR